MEHSVANYKIRFLTGELAGRVFAVRNSGTLIGRRRDADIRPGGLDIGAEHVTLLPQSDHGVLLHVHANESARVNGDEVIGEGDFLLLCSDGFCELLPDDAMARTLNSLDDSMTNLPDLTAPFLDRAGRGQDNASAVVIRCRTIQQCK